MQNNIFKLLPWFIIAPLVVALCVTRCNRQAEKFEVKHPDSTAFFKGKLATIQEQGEALKQKWVKDSLEIRTSEIAHKQAAKKAIKERDEAKRNAQPFINTIPEVKEFVRVDSLSDKISTDRIKELETENVTTRDDLLAVIHSKDEELKVSHEYTDHLQVVIVDLNRQVRKERRKKTLYKITTGLAATIALYIAVKD